VVVSWTGVDCFEAISSSHEPRGNVAKAAFANLRGRRKRPMDEKTRAEDLACISSLAGIELKEEVFQAVLKLTELGVVPTATAQVLKQFCKRAVVEGIPHKSQNRVT